MLFKEFSNTYRCQLHSRWDRDEKYCRSIDRAAQTRRSAATPAHPRRIHHEDCYSPPTAGPPDPPPRPRSANGG